MGGRNKTHVRKSKSGENKRHRNPPNNQPFFKKNKKRKTILGYNQNEMVKRVRNLEKKISEMSNYQSNIHGRNTSSTPYTSNNNSNTTRNIKTSSQTQDSRTIETRAYRDDITNLSKKEVVMFFKELCEKVKYTPSQIFNLGSSIDILRDQLNTMVDKMVLITINKFSLRENQPEKLRLPSLIGGNYLEDTLFRDFQKNGREYLSNKIKELYEKQIEVLNNEIEDIICSLKNDMNVKDLEKDLNIYRAFVEKAEQASLEKWSLNIQNLKYWRANACFIDKNSRSIAKAILSLLSVDHTFTSVLLNRKEDITSD